MLGVQTYKQQTGVTTMNLPFMSGAQLQFSQDDEDETGEGFYWQREHDDWLCSHSFETKQEALTAMDEGKVIFGDRI